jgi:hypothetical protein
VGQYLFLCALVATPASFEVNYGYKATRPGPDAIVDDFKRKLLWMADHPGEWLWWGTRWSAPNLNPPLFERHFVSPGADESLLTGHRPRKWKPGLWLRRLDL